MKLRLIVAPLAQRDLGDIFDYVAAENPAAAREGLRKATSAPCIIFYRVTAEELQVVRVLHSSRDIDDAMLRM